MSSTTSPTDNICHLHTETQKLCLAVDDFCHILKQASESDEPESCRPLIEDRILKVFKARDGIHSILARGELSALDIDTIYCYDGKLYDYCLIALTNYQVNLGKWRYLFPKPEELNWWWKIDKAPYRVRDTIAYEEPVPWITIGSFLIMAFSACIIGITTQRLWQSGISLVGSMNLVLQVLVGVGLTTEKGREGATRIGLAILKGFSNLSKLLTLLSRKKNISSTKVPLQFPDKSSPFENERLKTRGYNYFFASCLFLAFSILIPFFVMPSAAAISHELGISAYNNNDLSSARFYLETAVNLQPEIPTLLQTKLAGSLYQLGNLYSSIGDIEKAVAFYEQAVREDNQLILAYEPLVRFYSKGQKFDKAISLADEAINLLNAHSSSELKFSSPTDKEKLLYSLLVSRGNTYLLQNMPGVALFDFREAEKIVKKAENETLFITSSNKNNPPENSVLTTELYALRARANRMLAITDCNEQMLNSIKNDVFEMLQTIDLLSSTSEHRIWRVEATKKIDCVSPEE